MSMAQRVNADAADRIEILIAIGIIKIGASTMSEAYRQPAIGIHYR
jgi:hypothetical protein